LKCTAAPVILPEQGLGCPSFSSSLLSKVYSRPPSPPPFPGPPPELPGNRPVEPDPARDLACQSRCTPESLNSGPRHCITLAYFLLYYHPAHSLHQSLDAYKRDHPRSALRNRSHPTSSRTEQDGQCASLISAIMRSLSRRRGRACPAPHGMSGRGPRLDRA
jgi:hypothetical protein